MKAYQNGLNALQLFLTSEYSCSYLPARLARNLVADPLAIDNRIYTQLAELGFRRSGGHVYRPRCHGCQACLSLRIPVNCFRPNRSQRRTWKKNQTLQSHWLPVRFEADHYHLFERYVKWRHRDGGMDDTSAESYLSFVQAPWSQTFLCELRLESRLLAVAVTDRLDNGLSAVYTFFDPDELPRGLGTYAILWQITEAKRLGLSWLYLGYWLENCAKMSYKNNFFPHELFIDGRWVVQVSNDHVA
jgi:arginine-tRNA-protein transferase